MKEDLKNMKSSILSLIFTLGFVIIGGFVMQSCDNKDNTFSDFTLLTEKEKEFISQFDIIGIKHNEVMEQVYNTLTKDTEKNDISSTEILEKTFKSTKEATYANIESTNNQYVKLKAERENIKDLDDFLSMGFNLVVNNNAVKLKNTSGELIDSQQTIKDVLKNKSTELNNYLNKILAITDEASSIEQYNKEINSLVVSALKELSLDEMEILLCVSSTAKSSYEYWNNNLPKWESLFVEQQAINTVRLKNGSETVLDTPEFIKMKNDIIKWDAAGALGGAIAGSVTGPGIALCALAGGVTSSTSAAVVDIIDSYGKSMWEGFKNEFKNLFGW